MIIISLDKDGYTFIFQLKELLSLLLLHFRLFISAMDSVKREVELRTPYTAQIGTAITLTLTVQAEDIPESNYAVVHLTVIPEVRTITMLYNVFYS